ncbi:MAG TPA: hypothetical protein VG032_05325 [Acidimicrobiales bacterium]|nr:hypothetical protein [Acidimicrobiales bacterium]
MKVTVTDVLVPAVIKRAEPPQAVLADLVEKYLEQALTRGTSSGVWL